MNEDPAETVRAAPRINGAGLLFTTLLIMAPDALVKALASDPARALPLVRAAAAMGMAAAKVRLGRMLLEGVGLPEDRDAAFRWFWSAAGQGDVEAWNMVGRCFENGWGVSLNHAQAARCFARAAEAGDAWAHYNLGHSFLNGLGVIRNAAAAVEHYQIASDAGHARAMNLLGRCHEQGWGIAANRTEAARWYRRSAEAGYFRGQYNHGTSLYDEGAYDEAFLWMERAWTSAPQRSLSPIAAKLDEWKQVREAGRRPGVDGAKSDGGGQASPEAADFDGLEDGTRRRRSCQRGKTGQIV